MSIINFQQQAKDLYKRKDYSAALQHVDRALELQPSIPLLDLRAACHDKLNDFPAALKSAKKAIQLAPEDPTGYLRSGKILLRMEKLRVALDIYAYGLKNVKHVGQGYAALQKVHGDLLSQLTPPTSIDPLTVLPRELAVYILEYLTFRQRIAICRVSKQWDKFIRSEPDLWGHLDLSNTRSRFKIKTAFISKCINTARGKLKTVTLNNVYDFDKSLAALARLCSIEELSLLQTGPSQQSLITVLKPANKLRKIRVGPETKMSPQTILALLQNCRETLELIEYAHPLSVKALCDINAPQLKSLDTTLVSIARPQAGWSRFAQQSPNLEHLKIYEQAQSERGLEVNLALFTSLTCLDLDLDMRCAHQMGLPPTIRSLKLSIRGPRASKFFAPHDDSVPTFTYHLPYLQIVDLHIPGVPMGHVIRGLGLEYLAPADSVTLRDVLESPSKIKKFVTTAMKPDGSFVKWSQSRLEKVEYLAIREPLNSFHDEQMRDIAELQHLHTLDVSRSSITGVGVKDVVSAGSVKQLILNDCYKISKDAVDWARSKGIKVEYKMTTLAQGKRVRYG